MTNENLRKWHHNLQELIKQCWEHLKNPTLEPGDRLATMRLLLDAMIEQRKDLERQDLGGNVPDAA